MQVTETLAEGLKREFKVVVPASELGGRLSERLEAMAKESRMKGFRPGKVPVAYLRRLFGRQAMAEIVQGMLSDVARDTLSGRGERAAVQPEFKLPEDETEAEKVLKGEADLSYVMAYEVLPVVEAKDYKSIAVTRPVAEVSDDELAEELQRLADATRAFSPKDGAAADGDRVNLSYVGKIDGAPFDGGADENATIRIGQSGFIPGFVEQLAGVSAGDEKTITVTFPEDYGAARLAGKEATFDIVVKEVQAPQAATVDDELAKKLGLDDLEKLREALKSQLQGQYAQATRQKVKRQLLDQLDAMYAFDLPQKMVDQEFENIWRQITSDMSQSGRTFESEKTTEEEARAEYRKISERRVRLGLVLSDIGEKNKIEVTEEEVQRALSAQLRQFPGREQQLIDYYRQNPDAVAGLRAPIFEEKVVDFLLELVKVNDTTVSKEELLKEDEDDKAA